MAVMRSEHAMVTCVECEFEWFGSNAAHALRLLGSCTRCHGQLRFADDSVTVDEPEPLADMPAHLVLGTPRV